MQSESYRAAYRARANELRNARRKANPGSRAGEWKSPFRGMNETARRRAKQYGVPFTWLKPEMILERDGWVCYLCALPVTRETLSFDHVIPMSRGGGHTADNVRVAHLACNRAKWTGFVSEVVCPNCNHSFVP